MVNHGIRSHAVLSEILPTNDLKVKLGTTITFKFKTSEEDDYEIFIVNNKGKEIHSLEISLQDLMGEASYQTSEKGLFYWSIENIDETLHTGKFIID